MKFADGLIKAYRTRWTFVNSFTAQFDFSLKAKKVMNWIDETHGKDINLNIIGIDLPQFTNQPIEVFVANKWVIHNGRDEMYRYSITFRDQDQFEYYKKFQALYKLTREDYFDNVKFNLIINKDADYFNEIDTMLISLNESMIESISQIQLNNTTENQIGEFSVNFKCVSPILAAPN